jgi:dTMP kinase
MPRGKLITLEGGEGAGKSTQARLLAGRLQRGGLDVVVTREPGGTVLGESIRELILASQPTPFAEFLLFAAARAEHVAQRIAPALDCGQWVVCDRFIDSTRVYQGRLAAIPGDLVRLIEVETAGRAWPDLTLILDLAPEAGLERAMKRGAANRYDAAGIAYHRELRAGFLAIARAEPDRCAVIDAAGNADEVGTAVWAAVSARLGIEA